MPRDPYDVIGVPRGSTPEELRAAFRRAQVQHHPDRNPDDPGAAGRFREVIEAYEAIEDDLRRANGRPKRPRVATVPHDWSNIEAYVDSLLHDETKEEGADAEETVTVTRAEAENGVVLSIDIETPNGGHLLKISIPAGSKTGTKIRYAGKGHAPAGTFGVNGDLVVTVVVEE